MRAKHRSPHYTRINICSTCTLFSRQALVWNSVITARCMCSNLYDKGSKRAQANCGLSIWAFYSHVRSSGLKPQNLFTPHQGHPLISACCNVSAEYHCYLFLPVADVDNISAARGQMIAIKTLLNEETFQSNANHPSFPIVLWEVLGDHSPWTCLEEGVHSRWRLVIVVLSNSNP